MASFHKAGTQDMPPKHSRSSGDDLSSERGATIQRQPTATAAAAAAAHGAADVTRRMVCGGLAGMIAKTVTNPLDRIRMLSQTGEHGSKQKKPSALSLYRSIIANEGVLGLWAGNGANLLRVFPAKAVVFSTNDIYRKFMYRLSGRNAATEPLPSYLSFLAGGMAGVSASAVTYPLDLARGRITGKLAGADKKKHYSGIINTVVMTAKEEGFSALYKGVTPTVLGALPYEGIKFGTVGVLEGAFPKDPDSDRQSLICRKVMFGGCGGVVAGLTTYPNDTVRRMLQLQGSKGTTEVYASYFDCVKQIYSRYGIRRFYNGVAVNIIRMAPNTGEWGNLVLDLVALFFSMTFFRLTNNHSCASIAFTIYFQLSHSNPGTY